MPFCWLRKQQADCVQFPHRHYIWKMNNDHTLVRCDKAVKVRQKHLMSASNKEHAPSWLVNHEHINIALHLQTELAYLSFPRLNPLHPQCGTIAHINLMFWHTGDRSLTVPIKCKKNGTFWILSGFWSIPNIYNPKNTNPWCHCSAKKLIVFDSCKVGTLRNRLQNCSLINLNTKVPKIKQLRSENKQEKWYLIYIYMCVYVCIYQLKRGRVYWEGAAGSETRNPFFITRWCLG